jgi:hypothetical protein
MSGFKDKIRTPSAKFPTVGTTVEGVVLELIEAPVPTFDKNGRPTGVQATDAEDNPLWQTDVLLETSAGKVTLHTDGGISWSIGRALGELDAEDLEVGDTLQVEYSGDGEATAKGRTAPKQYTAAITKK